MIHVVIVFVARRAAAPDSWAETEKNDQVGGAWATADSDQEGVLPIHRACDSSLPTEEL
jgi:hypothetical protein